MFTSVDWCLPVSMMMAGLEHLRGEGGWSPTPPAGRHSVVIIIMNLLFYIISIIFLIIFVLLL